MIIPGYVSAQATKTKDKSQQALTVNDPRPQGTELSMPLKVPF